MGESSGEAEHAAPSAGPSRAEVVRWQHGQPAPPVADWVATEEPLEVRVEGTSVAVLMRTPGHDRELVAGFLFSEGLVTNAADLFEISFCPGSAGENVVDALLAGGAPKNLDEFSRHVFSSAGCGICGRTVVETSLQKAKIPAGGSVSAEVLYQLPNTLRQRQETFEQTGGLHAAALFDLQTGAMDQVFEDVGRHNAVDKAIGARLLANQLPASDAGLMLSGRVAFELMQKSAVAGISVVAAVSAPSSLAVAAAKETGQTLVGFLRGKGMNVYHGGERIG